MLKHAESNGLMCFDEISTRKSHRPVYVRIYKGLEETSFHTTNSLFEIMIYNQEYTETISRMGYFLQWRNAKAGDFK